MQVILDYKEYERLKDNKERSDFSYFTFIKYSTKLEEYLSENDPNFNIIKFMSSLEKTYPGEFVLNPAYKKSGAVGHHIAPVLKDKKI